ncbi:MAG: hypothetical protein HZB61_10325 [Nitrospirae bacterium]|nr:hypothetical protein [Nitrospirota bacterium]
MPEPKALHKDAVLSNLSIKYRNADMIWPFLMPVVKVNKRSDVYYVYNKEDSFKLVDDRISPKGYANEADWGVADANYSVKDHAQGDWVPQETIDNSDNPLQPEIDTNDFLNMLLDVAQEKRVADIVFAVASYPTGNKVQLSGNDQWGGSTDDPIDDIQTAIEACFQRANTLAFGVDAWLKFRKLPEILDACKATAGATLKGGMASAQEVATLFEVERVLIGRSRYNSSKPGQTAAYTRLWGKHCAALYVDPSPGIKTVTFGVTFAETLRFTARDFDKRRGLKGAHYIRPGWNSDEKVVASDCGYLIEDAVA